MLQEGRLRRLESLALLPDELRFGEGNEEEGVAVADMVWVATDAFQCVIFFLWSWLYLYTPWITN